MSTDLDKNLAHIRAVIAEIGDNPFDQRDHVGQALVARLAETEALLCLADGLGYSFNPALKPLSDAFNDVIGFVEKRITRTIDVPVDNDDPAAHDLAVTQQIEQREQAMAWLDQARITATLTLLHMSKAMAASPKPQLKAV